MQIVTVGAGRRVLVAVHDGRAVHRGLVGLGNVVTLAAGGDNLALVLLPVGVGVDVRMAVGTGA